LGNWKKNIPSCAEAIFICALLGNKKGINLRGGFK
jgi:hypothetical protein